MQKHATSRDQGQIVTGASPWDRADWSKKPNDIKELWALIGQISFAMGSNTRAVWRGMARDRYQVKSSLVRMLEDEGVSISERAVRERELKYLAEAREWGLGVSEFGQATDLHLLAMLQHHGAPTRLIDVTYNPLTALWFACQDRASLKHSGVLVSFLVTNTEQYVTTNVPPLTFETIDQPETASLQNALAVSGNRRTPVLVVPKKPDTRMTVQEGLFITSAVPDVANDNPSVGLPPADPRGFRKLMHPPPVRNPHMAHLAPETFSMVGLIISPRMKEQLLPILENSFNRSARTMYPDLSGFATSIPRPRQPTN